MAGGIDFGPNVSNPGAASGALREAKGKGRKTWPQESMKEGKGGAKEQEP